MEIPCRICSLRGICVLALSVGHHVPVWVPREKQFHAADDGIKVLGLECERTQNEGIFEKMARQASELTRMMRLISTRNHFCSHLPASS